MSVVPQNPQRELERYCFLRNLDPCVVLRRHKPVSIDDAELHLACIDELVKAKDYAAIINTVKHAVTNNCRPNEEAMFVLAYCVRKVESEEFRTKVYAALPSLIVSQEDMFQFVDDFNRLMTIKGGFGRGMRKGMTQWYEKHTPVELAEMFGAHRGLNRWQHKDILHLIHIKTKDPVRQQMYGTVFKRGCKLLESEGQVADETELMERPAGISRFHTICRLKICESPKDAAEMIKLHNLKLDCVPAHLQHSPEVWEALLPSLTYPQMLQALMKLNDLRLLKQTEPFAKKFSQELGNLQKVADSKIHPAAIYLVMRLYEQKKRYTESVKESHHAKKVERFHIEQNAFVTKKLQVALNHAMSHHPQTGLRYQITIDLRKGLFHRKVYNNNQVTCMQATLLVVLALLKREKEVTINTFTEDGGLQPVLLEKSMTFEKALEFLDQHKKEKTKLNLKRPLLDAIKTNKKVDVFLTIVDSIGRACPTKTPPMEELQLYRSTLGRECARYVVLNLARKKQDFLFEQKQLEGIFEITGFTQDVPKYIAAFAKRIIN